MGWRSKRQDQYLSDMILRDQIQRFTEWKVTRTLWLIWYELGRIRRCWVTPEDWFRHSDRNIKTLAWIQNGREMITDFCFRTSPLSSAYEATKQQFPCTIRHPSMKLRVWVYGSPMKATHSSEGIRTKKISQIECTGWKWRAESCARSLTKELVKKWLGRDKLWAMSDPRELEGRALKPGMKTFPREQWATSTRENKSSTNWENLHQFWHLEGYWWLLNAWILAMIYWMKLKAEQKTSESMIKGDFSMYLEWKEREGPGDGQRTAQSRAGDQHKAGILRWKRL